MDAARYYGQRDLRVTDVPEAPLGNSDVRIDVYACGICGTDLREYGDGPIMIPDAEPHPVTGASIPVTMGHEISGTVAEIGADVTGVGVGDPVTVNPMIGCGDCEFCQRGRDHHCMQLAAIGIHGRGGGFAESVVVPADRVVPLPDSIPLEFGALVEPLSISVHAVRRAGVSIGNSIAVFGAGPIGLGIVQAARAAGASEILVSEPVESRREIADAVGATALVDPSAEDPVQRIKNATDSGVDVGFEVAGIEPAYEQVVQSTTKLGRMTVVSLFEDRISTDPNLVTLAERSVVGSLGYEAGQGAANDDFSTVISLLSDDRLNPESMISTRISLEDIVDDGFEALRDRTSEEVKILVQP